MTNPANTLLLQDLSRGLSKWLSNTPNSRARIINMMPNTEFANGFKLKEQPDGTMAMNNRTPPAMSPEALDAARYRFLREQQWDVASLFVVAGSKALVRLGTDCPSLDRLDAAIDAAILSNL